MEEGLSHMTVVGSQQKTIQIRGGIVGKKRCMHVRLWGERYLKKTVTKACCGLGANAQ